MCYIVAHRPLLLRVGCQPGIDLRAEAVWGFREGLETTGGTERVFAAVHLERASVVASFIDGDDHVADGIEDLRSSGRGRVVHRRAAYAAVEVPLWLMCGSSIWR